MWPFTRSDAGFGARRVLLACLLWTCACGGSSTPAVARPAPLPSTQADPPAYRPDAADQALAGESAGLSASGGREAARQLALTLLEAVRTGDEDTLSQLLPSRVARSLPRVSSMMNPAEGVIHGVLDPRHRQAAGPALPLADLVDLEHIQTRPLSERLHRGVVPAGLASDDVFVVMPLTPAGRRFFAGLLPGWRLIGGVIVRPGVSPQVLGL